MVSHIRGREIERIELAIIKQEPASARTNRDASFELISSFELTSSSKNDVVLVSVSVYSEEIFLNSIYQCILSDPRPC